MWLYVHVALCVTLFFPLPIYVHMRLYIYTYQHTPPTTPKNAHYTVPYGPLSNAEALVALHNVDPEASKLPLKKYVLHSSIYMYILFVCVVSGSMEPTPHTATRTILLVYVHIYPQTCTLPPPYKIGTWTPCRNAWA